MESIEQMLKNTDHPEFLREAALFMHQQLQSAEKEVKRLREEKAKKEAAKQIWLNQTKSCLHKLKVRFFSRGRETLNKDRGRRDEEKQLLLHAQSLAAKPSKSLTKDLEKREDIHFIKPGQVIKLAQKKDPVLKEDHAKVEEVKDFFETSTEITVTERVYTEVIHKRQKYRVTNEETGKETLVTTPGATKLFPGCRYSVDLALSVVSDKFLNHLPYERQRRQMERCGLNLSVMTMYRMSEMTALHMEKVVEAIRDDVFKAHLACHLDETPWPLTGKGQQNGYMWVLSNQAGSYYRFEPTRSGDVAEELLKGYKGSIITDKFAGYLRFEKNSNYNWGLCWSHARREFLDLEESYPEEVNTIITEIDKLFEIEHKAKTWDELEKLRKTLSKDQAETIKEILKDLHADFFDQDDFCKAINYVLSSWSNFTAFIEDVTLPLSNNDAERALRHSVLGRKNFYGSKTINGADTASTLYTVIETCKRVELDPISYMRYVIEENHNGNDPLSPLKYAQKQRKI